MQLMKRRDVAMEVWQYNGRQRDGRDEAFVGGGSGSKSNSILLVVRDSTPDCHHAIACNRKRSQAIACNCKRSHAISSDRMRSRKKTFLSRLSEFLKMHRERKAGQKVCLKCFFTTTVNRFHLLFFSPFSKRKKKRDSFYTAKRVSSFHSCRDETRLAIFSVPFPQNKF